jgi:hypothetical protein
VLPEQVQVQVVALPRLLLMMLLILMHASHTSLGVGAAFTGVLQPKPKNSHKKKPLTVEQIAVSQVDKMPQMNINVIGVHKSAIKWKNLLA